jgi:hypothetical protein
MVTLLPSLQILTILTSLTLDLMILKVTLSPTFLSQFDSTLVENNLSLFDTLPAEDPNWRELADHQNSPC